ncbi:MAG: BPSS1780 family membrane protein [Burkholderiales bacterium]
MAWWSEGWQVFMAAPGLWIGLCLLLFVFAVVVAFVPILGTIAQSLLAPVFAGGIALGAHALAKGRPLTIVHLFEGFQGGRLVPLLIVGLFYLAAAFVIWLVFVVLLLGMAGGAGLFSAISSIGSNGWAPILASIGVAALVFVPIALIGFSLVAMAYWYAPALVVLNGEEPIEALKKSFRACWTNLGATLVYGLIFIGLAIVASIPFGLGWIVFAPVFAGSWYASWRETFDA